MFLDSWNATEAFQEFFSRASAKLVEFSEARVAARASPGFRVALSTNVETFPRSPTTPRIELLSPLNAAPEKVLV